MSAPPFLPLRALAIAAALWLCACDCDGDTGPTPVPEPTTGEHPSAATFFPLAAGDRWRVEVEGGPHHNTGVTGVDSAGIAAIHGTSHALAERYRASDDEVALVTPDGEVLVPLLRTPLTAGATWSYRLAEQSVAVPCEVEVTADDVTHRIGDAELTGCVELRRSCAYPAGSPFTRPTEHRTDELYCPGVGRVRERGRFTPPPPSSALPADRTERVVAFRVAGAPVQPSRGDFDCDDFILLPTDVAAACGPSVAPTESPAGISAAGSCRYELADADARLVVHASEAGDADVEVFDAPAVDFEESGIRVQIRADEGVCAPDRLSLLPPLLRSLLR